MKVKTTKKFDNDLNAIKKKDNQVYNQIRSKLIKMRKSLDDPQVDNQDYIRKTFKHIIDTNKYQLRTVNVRRIDVKLDKDITFLSIRKSFDVHKRK
jgi:hypothetical protein